MQANKEIGPAEEQDTPTVLVAEDEVLLRMTLSDHLRTAGFHVLEAANGEEARKIVGAMGGVDILISDVHMPQSNEGFELAKWVGQHYPRIPVILASGSPGAARTMREASLANVTDFVVKPYSETEMERLARVRLSARDASPK
jgi:CheY-like chemotaxis protein